MLCLPKSPAAHVVGGLGSRPPERARQPGGVVKQPALGREASAT